MRERSQRCCVRKGRDRQTDGKTDKQKNRQTIRHTIRQNVRQRLAAIVRIVIELRACDNRVNAPACS